MRASAMRSRETEPAENGQHHVDRGHGGHGDDGDAARASGPQGPLAAEPSSERRLARTRIRISVIGVMTPSRTWVFRIRVIRLPGTRTTAAPTRIWTVKMPEEDGGLAEARGDRALHPDRLGHGVGGRQRHDRGGQGRGAEQPEPEEHLGRRRRPPARAPGRPWSAEVSGPGPPDGGAGGHDDRHGHERGQDRRR